MNSCKSRCGLETRSLFYVTFTSTLFLGKIFIRIKTIMQNYSNLNSLRIWKWSSMKRYEPKGLSTSESACFNLSISRSFSFALASYCFNWRIRASSLSSSSSTNPPTNSKFRSIINLSKSRSTTCEHKGDLRGRLFFFFVVVVVFVVFKARWSPVFAPTWWLTRLIMKEIWNNLDGP